MASSNRQQYRLVKRTVDGLGRSLRVFNAMMRGEPAHQSERECARRRRKMARIAEVR